jgi:hypothetical protein
VIRLEDFKNPLDCGLHRETSPLSILYNIIGYKNIMDTILPAHCQRELCWTDEQYASYVRNVLETQDFGSFIIYQDCDSELIYLVDGQHRANAWKRFIDGSLSVKINDDAITFNDFCLADQRQMGRWTGAVTTLKSNGYPKEAIELVYNRFNFSGVAHNRKEGA